MSRIDLAKTIEGIDFPEKVWEWLDLFGEVLGITQDEAIYQEQRFVADTPFKRYLLCSINKDLCTLNSIYILLRCEFIHQASSHVRLFCESVITLKYISLDPTARSELFWRYSIVEGYKISSSILGWEEARAKPFHVERVKSFLWSISEEYEKVKQLYTFADKGKRKRSFVNWCNRSISAQAKDCGHDFIRLYELVYSQMSSYIHGSAWSLRRQISYSRKHYQPDVILNDVAAIIRTALVVWVEWAKYLVLNLNWRLREPITELPKRIEDLEEKHFPLKV